MSNYQEQTITGTQWTRAFHVSCENPVTGAKRLTYHEETAIDIGGNVVTSRKGQTLECPYDPSNEGDTFNLVHPVTGEVVGTMTEQALYIALGSHYVHKATQRDAA